MESATDLKTIVRRIGAGDIYNGGRAATVPGPGHSSRDRSLSLRVSDDGARVLWYSHANDDAAKVWRHLGIENSEPERLTTAEQRRRRAEAQRAIAADLARRMAFCREVWAATVEAAGSPAQSYLRGRGITGLIPPALRFHPAAPLDYEGKRLAPAMVAIVTGPDGRSSGLHVTALKADGSGKAPLSNPRRMYGAVGGGSVQLGPVPDHGELAVAEGIETALSYRALTGLTTWATLSTSGLLRLEVPRQVKRLVIAADGDPAGIKAARDLAERASRRCECVVMPSPDGSDWNDELTGARQ